MSGSRQLSLTLPGALMVALMLAFRAGLVAAETADDRRLHLLAGMAASHARDVQALLAKGADPNWKTVTAGPRCTPRPRSTPSRPCGCCSRPSK